MTFFFHRGTGHRKIETAIGLYHDYFTLGNAENGLGGNHQKHSRKDYQVGNGIFPTCPGGVLPCGQFTLPTLGKEGNETPNQFRNPGYADTDFSVKKVTQIRESINFEFRVDIFNLLNRVNLNGVDTNLQDGGFGQTSSTLPPRNMLLGAKLNF